MSTSTFRWGILGPGRIAHRFADAVPFVESAVVHAVASRDLGRAEAFAAKVGAARAYGSYEALVEDPDLDAIYIATPHRFHFEQTQQCLLVDKPVLCEKPLTVNATEARQLIETARRRRIFLMEAMWTRHLPIYRRIRSWLDAGRIGDLKLLTSTFGFRVPVNPHDRLFSPALAGGALLDIGVYNLAVSQSVLGANPISGTAQSVLTETGVDAMTLGTLRYEGGVASQFACTFQAPCTNAFTIYGTDGQIRIHPQFWKSTDATLDTPDHTETASEPFRGNGFEYEIEEAMRCIRMGLLESPAMPHADTLGTMTLMDHLRADIGLRYPFESD